MKRQAKVGVQENILRDVMLIFGIGAGTVLVLLREKLLPDRFLGDETTIRQLAQQLWETPGDPSYDRVADIYRFFGLAHAPLLAGLLGFAISLLPYFVVLRKYPVRYSILPLVILTAGILLSCVYLGSYSKEVFVIPIVILVLTLSGKRRNVFVIAAMMCLYALLFREYWYMSAIVFVLLCLLRESLRSVPMFFALSLGGVFLGSILFTYVLGVPADYYRTSVNSYREAYGDVNSLIDRYVSLPEPLGGSVNNTLSFMFLQFPLPLAIKGSAYYLTLFVFFSLLWGSFYFRAQPQNVQCLPSRDRELVLRASAFILSFALTQAFFEPDYGSALKHLTPLLPLFLVPWLMNRTRPSNIGATEQGEVS